MNLDGKTETIDVSDAEQVTDLNDDTCYGTVGYIMANAVSVEREPDKIIDAGEGESVE